MENFRISLSILDEIKRGERRRKTERSKRGGKSGFSSSTRKLPFSLSFMIHEMNTTSKCWKGDSIKGV